MAEFSSINIFYDWKPNFNNNMYLVYREIPKAERKTALFISNKTKENIQRGKLEKNLRRNRSKKMLSDSENENHEDILSEKLFSSDNIFLF